MREQVMVCCFIGIFYPRLAMAALLFVLAGAHWQ